MVPEYREVNRQLVQELFRHMPNPFVHVDLATGTGLVPQLLIEEAEKRGFRGTIIGIDRSAKALEIAEATTPRPAGHRAAIRGSRRAVSGAPARR